MRHVTLRLPSSLPSYTWTLGVFAVAFSLGVVVGWRVHTRAYRFITE